MSTRLFGLLAGIDRRHDLVEDFNLHTSAGEPLAAIFPSFVDPDDAFDRHSQRHV